MSLVGVDLGTSGIRAVAVDATGRQLTSVGRRTDLRHGPPGIVEIDAEECLRVVISLLTELTNHEAVIADPVEAVSFSVQGEAVLPVDADGHALAPAPVSMDRRGTSAAALMAELVGPGEVHRRTGQPLHPMFSIYKIAAGSGAWRSPAVRGYRCLGDYIAARLGARPAIDTTMAARTGALEVADRQWSSPLLAALDIPAGMLPDVVPPGTVIGKVSAEAAASTGLRTGVPLVVGSHDQASSFWGAGGRIGSVSVFSLGSSECLTVGSASRPAGLDGTGLASYPVTGDDWLTLAGTAAGGWMLDWFAGLVRSGTPAERDALFDAAAAEPPDLLVLPYFAGSGTVDNDPRARGTVTGLTLDTTREQLARAFLESSAFELRKIVDTLADRGLPVGQLRVVGGGLRNQRALAIRASAARLPLVPVPGHVAARGAALQAGVGIGRFTSFADLPAPVPGPVAGPDPRTTGWYAEQSRRYRALYLALSAHDRSYHEKETP